MKDFEECKKEKIIIHTEADRDRAKSLLEKALVRKEFWAEKRDAKYDFMVVEGYYEIIKELITALISIRGLSSSNHECLIGFFAHNYPQYAYEAEVIDTLRTVRNTIGYRGIYTDPMYLNSNRLEFEHIIQLLAKLLREKL